MKATHSQDVQVVFQGSASKLPSEMPQTAGLLIYRDDRHIITYWDGAEWIPMTEAGWILKFHTEVPTIPVGNWAIVVSPRMDISAGELYQSFTAIGLMMAMHSVPESEVTKSASVSEQLGVDDFTDVRDDVEAFIEEEMARQGVYPLAK